jgi:tetratricopeptide (TPR) repeat protein
VAADKTTILENAQQFTSKGHYDKAIAEWKKLVTGTPADGTIFNTIGDLHLKRNASNDAIEAYFQAASAFRAGDAALKAIALYKKILKVDPSRLDAYRCLGDLNAERGLVSNAVSDYLALAKMYLKAAKVAETVEIYRKVVALDPANAEARQYLGEGEAAAPPKEAKPPAPSQAAPRDAGPAFHGGDAVMPAGAAGGAGKPPPEYSRQGYLDEAIKLTAGAKYTEAEELLNEVLSREPGDPEVCRLLATLHLKRGELACARAEFQFLAEAAMRAQDYVLAESMLLEYLKADPACIPLNEVLGRLYEQSGDAQSAAQQYAKALEGLQAHPDPEYPTLPSELYEKISSLAPGSPLAAKFAAAFPGLGKAAAPVAASVEPAAPLQEPEPAREVEASQPQPAEPVSTGGSSAFKFAGSAAAASTEAAPAPAPAAKTGSSFKFAAKSEAEPVAAAPAAEAERQEAPPPAAARPDYEEHFRLGQAFCQMGLPGEAVQELEAALNDPRFFAESCRLLAQCFSQQGQRQEAVSYLERAIADPRTSGDASMLVRYDLGLLYESDGSVERAMQVFSAIASFQDVPERLARLSRGDAGGHGREAGEPGMVAVGPGGDGGERKKRRISYL